MKFIFIIALAAVLFAAFTYPESKDPALYLGHAEYSHGNMSTCVVRPIIAKDSIEAKRLFKKYVDSIVAADNGVLERGNNEVWFVWPSTFLKNNHDDINRSY